MTVFGVIGSFKENSEQIISTLQRHNIFQNKGIINKVLILDYMQNMYQVEELVNKYRSTHDQDFEIIHITKWLSQRGEFFETLSGLDGETNIIDETHTKNYVDKGVERWFVDEFKNVFLKTKIHLSGSDYVTDQWSIIVDGVETIFNSEKALIHFFMDSIIEEKDSLIFNISKIAPIVNNFVKKSITKIFFIDHIRSEKLGDADLIKSIYESLINNQFLINKVVTINEGDYKNTLERGFSQKLVSLIPDHLVTNETGMINDLIILLNESKSNVLTTIKLDISNFEFKKYKNDIIELHHSLNREFILKGAGQNKKVVDILNFLAGLDYILYGGDTDYSVFVQRKKYTTTKLSEFNEIYYHLDSPDIQKKQTNNANKLVVFFLSLPPYDGLISNNPIDRSYTNMFTDIQRSLVKDTFVLRIADLNLVRGSFYVNSVNFPDYEDKIQSLIQKIKIENTIPDENVVMFGASRGAVGALLHGAKMNTKVVAVDPIINDQEYVQHRDDVHYVGHNRPVDLTDKFVNYMANSKANGVIISNKFISKNFLYLKRIPLPTSFKLISLNDNTVKEHAEFSRNSVPEQLMWLNAMLSDVQLLDKRGENKMSAEIDETFSKILYYNKESYRLEALKMYDDLQHLIWNKMLDMEVTMKRIQTEKLSIARYGDGENKLIANPYFNIGFQKNNVRLSDQLKDVLLHPAKNLMIGQPSKLFNDSHIRLWNDSFYELKYILAKTEATEYISTHITRPMFFHLYGEHGVQMWRNIWQDQNITIVTCEGSRFDLIPELFDNIKSSKVIYTKAKNAFSDIDNLINKLEVDDGDLILVSLGPTASILANEMAKRGKWILDVGHLAASYKNVFDGGKMPEALDIRKK